MKNIIIISKYLITIFFGVAGSFYVYKYISNLPKLENTFQSISLGMPMGEVKYVLGSPDYVLHPIKKFNFEKEDQTVVSKEEIANAKEGVNSFFDWHYSKSSSLVTVNFDSNKRIVKEIGCHFIDKNEFLLGMGICEINGIHALDDEDTVLDRLGKPSSSKIIDETKIMEFDSYNMKIFLEKRIVRGIVILNLADKQNLYKHFLSTTI
jgi:hypothetical protein